MKREAVLTLTPRWRSSASPHNGYPRRDRAAVSPRRVGHRVPWQSCSSILKVALFVGGFLISGTMSVLIYLYTKSQLVPFQFAQEKSRLRHTTHHKKKPPLNWLDPKLSHPPDAMDLTHTTTRTDVVPEWQRHRYACLRHIRQRQVQVMADIGWAQDLAVVLVDPAYHANVGDHMITVAEQLFFKHTVVQECSYMQAGPWAPSCPALLVQAAASTQQTASQRRLAVWHGGGNWGDLWDTIHTTRTNSMTLLLQYNYTVLGMPQSLYFGSQASEQINAQRFRQAVVDGLNKEDASVMNMNNAQLATALQGRLIFTWRERESAARAKQLYPYATHIIMPDIAFQLGPYKNNNNAAKARGIVAQQQQQQQQQSQVDVLFFLRNDIESLYAQVRDRQSIRHLLSQHPNTARFTYSIVDWPDRLDRFESTDYYFTDTAIQLLRVGRVLICDRLHAAILAYLSGIPFVFVDQVSGEITKTFAVAMPHEDCAGNKALWDRADNLTDAASKAAVLWEQVRG